MTSYDDVCENCGIEDKPLAYGFCEGCTCRDCGANGTMNEWGLCPNCPQPLVAVAREAKRSSRC